MNKKHITQDFELDIVYSYIDYLLKRGQFLLVDAILKDLVFYVNSPYFKDKNLTEDEILGYLTCCLPAKSKLNNYSYFFNNVKYLFTEDELKGLE